MSPPRTASAAGVIRLPAATQHGLGLPPLVGRDRELEVLQGLGREHDDRGRVLYLYGPAGVGKTTLVREFARRMETAGDPVAFVDGERIEPSPEAFAAGCRDDARAVVVDTFERLRPIEAWVRDVFLPALGPAVVVVLAGQEPPSVEWRADPRWGFTIRQLPLRNLDADASRDYLTRRGVPAQQHESALRFTHGHPLALALVADVLAQRPGEPFDPGAEPDVVKALLDRFTREIREPDRRAALELCALARATTEDLLVDVLGVEDGHALFEWLRGVSFIEARPDGLVMHDTAEEALVSELRWRDPHGFADLHRRARSFYQRRLHETSGPGQQRVLLDYIYLHRHSSVVRPFFEWQSSGTATLDRLRPEDTPALVSMTERHEGAESAALAQRWLRRDPDGARVLRNALGEATGYMMALSLDRMDEDDRSADAAVAAADAHLRERAPLRSGEVATLFRFWMDAEAHQQVSPGQSLLFVEIVRHYLVTPRLAYTFIPCADPEFWAPVFAYAFLERLESADFGVGGRRFGMYGHDWRAQPPTVWLEALAEREIAPDAPSPEPVPSSPVLVLSEAEFRDAVREALRCFHEADSLGGNPLLRSRVVVDRVAADAGDRDRVNALRARLNEAATPALETARSRKIQRAVHHTFFQPAATQELAAEAAGMPFSTYRRHLRDGVQHIADQLWRQELGEG